MTSTLPIDLSRVTYEQMEPLVGGLFHIAITDGSAIELVLERVIPLPERGLGGRIVGGVAIREKPFCVTFKGPADRRLPDQTVPMSDPHGQVWQLFISAVEANDEGIYYESLFG